MGPHSNSVLYFSFSNLRTGIGFDYMTKIYSEFMSVPSPKAALLFWFFGGFTCGVPLFFVIFVIY